MSKNKLDKQIRKSFENYEAPVSQEFKLKLSKKITRFNFLKFNLASFNIFYLTLAIIGIVLVLSVSLVAKNKSNNDNSIENNIHLLKKEPNIKSLDTTTKENNKKPIIADTIKITKKRVNDSETNLSNSEQTIDSSNTTKITVKTDSQIINSDFINKNQKPTNNPDTIETQETKKTVYDTVVSNVNVTIKDTVKTVVRETIKIKKPRKKDK
ncbi:MAG: hypothetical protein PHZ24_00010 [Bacteroidales bacterium]|nr:hypothetical protein [Bacteroidales bacterium]MDY0140313.1 hypothetical protein [Bacteroidales bacterium]